MSKLTGSQLIESVANSYRINVAACREANDMLTKENAELRAKLAAASPLRDQVAGIGRADYPPTQAQIEAAKPEEFDHIRNMLTNYAERLQDKNEEPPGQFLLANAFLRARSMLDLLLLRLTAAAEAGELTEKDVRHVAMIAPTQAQIEAAKIARCVRGCTTDEQYQELTAKIATALTAAAEAGKFPEPTTEQIEVRWERKFKDAVRNIENKAIERCAQELERRARVMQSLKLDYATVVASELARAADAIRAMKEEG